MTPSPTARHQRAAQLLSGPLNAYVRALGIGEALQSPADIKMDSHGLVQPDVFVQGLVGGRPTNGWNLGAPSTARADRTTKRMRFQRAGIPEYWIVDMDARTIESLFARIHGEAL